MYTTDDISEIYDQMYNDYKACRKQISVLIKNRLYVYRQINQ